MTAPMWCCCPAWTIPKPLHSLRPGGTGSHPSAPRCAPRCLASDDLLHKPRDALRGSVDACAGLACLLDAACSVAR